MANNTTELTGWKKYCKEQNIEFSVQRILIDGLGGMAHGLFASLLIGTIFNTIGVYLFDLNYTMWGQEFALLVGSKGFCYAVQGAAMAGAIAYSMKAPPMSSTPAWPLATLPTPWAVPVAPWPSSS